VAEKRVRESGDGRKPASRVPKAERILNLIAVLLSRREPVPIAEILGKVTGYDDDASKSTLMRRFERDKQVLRKMGIPIDHCPPTTYATEGYTISRESYFLDELELPDGGPTLLRALFFAAARGPSGELQDDLRAALLKLGFEVPGADPVEVVTGGQGEADRSPTEGRVLALPLGDQAAVQKNIEILSEAVLRRKRVKVKYYTLHRDETTTRDVDPYGLGLAGQAWNRASWYLVGHCHLRNDLRVFKVDRIRGTVSIHKADSDVPDFDPPPNFRVRDHLNRARWEWRELAHAIAKPGAPRSSGPPFVARIRFEKGVAAAVRGLVPSARVEAEDDERTTLAFDVVDRRAFARFLLAYLGKFEIGAPADLVDEVKSLAREVVDRNRSLAARPAGGSAS
jgi:proteasome accessory factor B